jgi:hypothetical protein
MEILFFLENCCKKKIAIAPSFKNVYAHTPHQEYKFTHDNLKCMCLMGINFQTFSVNETLERG